jgi:hypothetical protein
MAKQTKQSSPSKPDAGNAKTWDMVNQSLGTKDITKSGYQPGSRPAPPSRDPSDATRPDLFKK